MSEIYLEEKYILEYIEDLILGFKDKKVSIDNARFHHNTDYNSVPSIIRNGLLSLEEQNKLGVKHYTKEILTLMDDTSSHINGSKGISLSVYGLKDLYPHEDEYNPFDVKHVDILISSNVRAHRNTVHYGNEYIACNSILADMFKSIDIRLIGYIYKLKNNKQSITDTEEIISIINKFNCLKNISLALKDCSSYIPLREMSDNTNATLNTEKISTTPTLVLKK